MRQLSRQACAPFEILIDCIHRHLKQPGAERPRLSEDDLLSVLDTLLTGPEAAGLARLTFVASRKITLNVYFEHCTGL